MAKPIADLVEEVIILIETDELTLETARQRYAANWLAIGPAIELALQINTASQPPLISQRPFVALDKAAGWESLKTQLQAAPQPKPRLMPKREPLLTWREWLGSLLDTRGGRTAVGALMTMLVFVTVFGGISEARPGDALYKAKLGWDFTSELTSFTPNDRTRAALAYSERRLSELERLAFVGKPEQVAEAQGQYLRGLDASLRYSDQKDFSDYNTIYTVLNKQRERVAIMTQNEYIFGTRAQISLIANRLDNDVYILAPKVPGSVVPSEPTATPTPLR